MRDVLALTDGELKLWPVTLYGSLEELVRAGWIKALSGPPADADDDSARRRWFRITPAGRRALAAEVRTLQGVVGVARRRLAQIGEAP
jgi:DNA-binding PadR family transcriptional regulator